MDTILVYVFKKLNSIPDKDINPKYQHVRVSDQILTSFHADIQNCLNFLINTNLDLTSSTYNNDHGVSSHEFYTTNVDGSRLKKYRIEFTLLDVSDDLSKDTDTKYIQIGDRIFYNPVDCWKYLQDLGTKLVEGDRQVS